MSRLRVYWPESYAADDVELTEEPAIVPFPTRSRLLDSYSRPRTESRKASLIRICTVNEDDELVTTPVERARVLFSNRCCPHCHHPVVEPIELDDALINRAGQPIPGTATLVGFHCEACDAEWAAGSARRMANSM